MGKGLQGNMTKTLFKVELELKTWRVYTTIDYPLQVCYFVDDDILHSFLIQSKRKEGWADILVITTPNCSEVTPLRK